MLRYGEEIGMGEDLSLHGPGGHPDADAVVSDAQRRLLHRRPQAAGPSGRRPAASSATSRSTSPLQRNDTGSLLAWFERMIRTLRECPEIGTGPCTHVDVPTPPGVLAHRADDGTGTDVVPAQPRRRRTPPSTWRVLEDVAEAPTEMLADRDYGAIDLSKLAVAGYGYRWIRLCRHLSPPRAGTQ